MSLVMRSRRSYGLEAQTLLDDLLHDYTLRSAAFFDHLRVQAGQTSPEQFAFFRENYFARTLTTLPCLRRALTAAKHQRFIDGELVQLIQMTVEDEEGLGFVLNKGIPRAVCS